MMKARFRSTLCCVAMTAIAMACSCSLSEGIPATWSGAVTVEPPFKATNGLYDELKRQGEQYGLVVYSNISPNKREWQLQIFCRPHNLAAFARTASDGESVLFQAYRYAFKSQADYDRYKAQMLHFFQQVGDVHGLRDEPPLDQKEFEKRAEAMELTVTPC